jgi:putative ABC transport system substrate-binding protein
MRRRRFVQVIAGLATAWPQVARAQRAAIARVGVLLYSTPQADPNIGSVLAELRNLGYVEGRNIAFDYRYAEGNPEHLPELAAELVRLRPDAIVTLGGDVTGPAAKSTQTIPLVFISSVDPVQLGFVRSLARPGGNATGVTLLSDELASKRLALLKEAVQKMSHVAFVWNPDHADNEFLGVERAASALGIKLHTAAVRRASDFADALRTGSNAGVDSLYVVSSRHTVRNMPLVVEFATKHRLPLAGGWGAWAKSGGLLSYGPNLGVMARHAAGYIDKILKGAKPANLPVQTPTKFELIINLKTAKTLGLSIPPSLLARADNVIE